MLRQRPRCCRVTCDAAENSGCGCDRTGRSCWAQSIAVAPLSALVSRAALPAASCCLSDVSAAAPRRRRPSRASGSPFAATSVARSPRARIYRALLLRANRQRLLTHRDINVVLQKRRDAACTVTCAARPGSTPPASPPPGLPSSKRRQDPDTGITYRSLTSCPGAIGDDDMYDPNFRWIDHHSCLRQSSLRVDHTQKPDSETDTPCSIPGSIPGRSVCRSGAFKRGKDLAPRTYWEDHIQHIASQPNKILRHTQSD